MINYVTDMPRLFTKNRELSSVNCQMGWVRAFHVRNSAEFNWLTVKQVVDDSIDQTFSIRESIKKMQNSMKWN